MTSLPSYSVYRLRLRTLKRIATSVLAVLSLGAIISGARAQGLPAKPTARQVIEAIQKHAGKSWTAPTVDTFKAGNPDTPVTGITTTVAATFDVLERAARSGKNLVITHEPTFYSHEDKTAPFEQDAVFQEKRDFIEKHNLVIWRFHDHWHEPQMSPDGILRGMVKALNWEKYQDPKDQRRFVRSSLTLDALASEMKSRLQIKAVRVVGDPQMQVTKIGFVPGAAGEERQIQVLARPDIEVLVIGEAREWETVEYAHDASSEHKKKALIILGHLRSEEEGMRNCAEWLKTFVGSVPVEFIPAGESYWPAK